MSKAQNSVLTLCWVIIIFGAIIGIVALFIYLAEDSKYIKPSPSEFCINNGYAGMRMLSNNLYYCYSMNGGNRRYFAWNGSEYKIEDDLK